MLGSPGSCSDLSRSLMGTNPPCPDGNGQLPASDSLGLSQREDRGGLGSEDRKKATFP